MTLQDMLDRIAAHERNRWYLLIIIVAFIIGLCSIPVLSSTQQSAKNQSARASRARDTSSFTEQLAEHFRIAPTQPNGG